MRCEDFLPLLYDLADGDLADGDRAALDAHMAVCSHCRKELESIKRADIFYKREIALEPPSGMEERLIAAMMKERASAAPKTLSARTRRAAYVAAAASLFSAVFYLVNALPESSQFIERAVEIGSSIDPTQWPERITESIRVLSEIGIAETFNRMFDSLAEIFRAIEGALPAPENYMIILVVAVAVLQVAISYRLLYREVHEDHEVHEDNF